jgi:transcription elongation factor Elf1
MLEEHFFTCPYCWEQISVLLDLSVESQSYVEDCEVCCNPISISFEASDATLTSFSADAAQ